MSKPRGSCFITGSKHIETIKALYLQRHAFGCFSAVGTRDEALAVVFDILRQRRFVNKQVQCCSVRYKKMV